MIPFRMNAHYSSWLFSMVTVITLLIGLPETTNTKVETSDIVGVWQPEDESYHVELYEVDGYYHGKIVWMEEPNDKIGRPKVDKLNPQRNLRANQIMGLEIITDLEYNDLDDNWEEGMIYNPTSGEMMKGSFQMLDRNTMELVGFVGFSLSEVTYKWTRVSHTARGDSK